MRDVCFSGELIHFVSASAIVIISIFEDEFATEVLQTEIVQSYYYEEKKKNNTTTVTNNTTTIIIIEYRFVIN